MLRLIAAWAAALPLAAESSSSERQHVHTAHAGRIPTRLLSQLACFFFRGMQQSIWLVEYRLDFLSTEQHRR